MTICRAARSPSVIDEAIREAAEDPELGPAARRLIYDALSHSEEAARTLYEAARVADDKARADRERGGTA
jgi:hypothetical protein